MNYNQPRPGFELVSPCPLHHGHWLECFRLMGLCNLETCSIFQLPCPPLNFWSALLNVSTNYSSCPFDCGWNCSVTMFDTFLLAEIWKFHWSESSAIIKVFWKCAYRIFFFSISPAKSIWRRDLPRKEFRFSRGYRILKYKLSCVKRHGKFRNNSLGLAREFALF